MRKIEYAVYLISYDVIQLCITSDYKEALEVWFKYQASHASRIAIYAINKESVNRFYQYIVTNQGYLKLLHNKYNIEYNIDELISKSRHHRRHRDYKSYNGLYLLEPFGSILDIIEK